MPQGIAVSLSTALLFSTSQLLNCGQQTQGPEAAYERFAKKVEEGKCATVYNALDRSSKARLDTYLETMVGLAFSAQDRADERLPALSDYVPGPIRLEDPTEEAPKVDEGPIVFQRPEPTDAGVAEVMGLTEPAKAPEEEEPEIPPIQSAALSLVSMDENALEAEQRKKALAALRDLRGKALFKELCRANMPPMALIFRESSLSDYEQLPVEAPVINGDEAELPLKVETKKKKTKKAKGEEDEEGKEAKAEEPKPIRLVLEGTRWRVVLEPMELQWYEADDGRVVPRFRSPILSLGVEMNADRTPTHAYDRIVSHVETGECDDFYDALDKPSRERMERVAPMMVGFASALGSADKSAADLPTRDGRALVLSICKLASLNDLKNTGLHLGQVVHEEVIGNRATLTVRSRQDKERTREVFMVREGGEWHMSIDAFADMLPNEDANMLADVEDED